MKVVSVPPLWVLIKYHCFTLQIEQLQQVLHEVEVSKAECEVQLEQLSLKNKLCTEEMRQLQGNLNTMKQEAQQYEEQIREKEAIVSSLRQELENNTEQHGKQKVDNILCVYCVSMCVCVFFFLQRKKERKKKKKKFASLG